MKEIRLMTLRSFKCDDYKASFKHLIPMQNEFSIAESFVTVKFIVCKYILCKVQIKINPIKQ